MDTTLFARPKIDCHCHLFDPEAFPYRPDTFYRPAGPEIATAKYLTDVMDTYGVTHALLVGPNSGYDTDNRCMLDAVRRDGARFKGIAVVTNDASRLQLQDLKAQGMVGVALNVALLGMPFYEDADGLCERAADLDLFVQVQVKGDQMLALAPRLLGSGARILVDHHGRPDVARGLMSPGFQALLGMAESGRCNVKLSGFDKFSGDAYPFPNARPFTEALIAAFGPQHCMWASDWPHVRAVQRLDYGPLLRLFANCVSSESMRRAILFETPKRLFGFQ